ncbi:PQQ-like beta-propeller repeat protein, partial [Candidatus Bathyarchaeota archaeon]|nr:PQQ-like beta-propeller repeat protein [Candidatus Bathyarchaeota archaeon]
MRQLKWAVGILFSLLLFQFYGATALRVSASSSTPTSTSVTQLWRFPTTGSVYASPVVANGYLYAGSSFRWGSIGHIYCLDAYTGAQIWNYTVDTYLYSGLTVGNGFVYADSGRGAFYALNATTGTEVWNTTEPVGRPVVAGSYLYFGGFGLYCFD